MKIGVKVQQRGSCTNSAAHSLLACEAEPDAFTTELGPPALDVSWKCKGPDK